MALSTLFTLFIFIQLFILFLFLVSFLFFFLFLGLSIIYVCHGVTSLIMFYSRLFCQEEAPPCPFADYVSPDSVRTLTLIIYFARAAGESAYWVSNKTVFRHVFESSSRFAFLAKTLCLGSKVVSDRKRFGKSKVVRQRDMFGKQSDVEKRGICEKEHKIRVITARRKEYAMSGDVWEAKSCRRDKELSGRACKTRKSNCLLRDDLRGDLCGKIFSTLLLCRTDSTVLIDDRDRTPFPD